MTNRRSYEVVVIGGGPAGMTTALYTTRLGHATAVVEREGGRHATVAHVHNLFGVSEDVSGHELAKHAIGQLEEYGGDYYPDVVDDVRTPDDADGRFVVDAAHATLEAERVVLATGFTDVGPPVTELRRFRGRGLFYCLHCDAYSLGDSSAFVMGHDGSAAEVAMLMLNFTADVELLLDGCAPDWGAGTDRQLDAHPVDIVEKRVTGAFAEDESAEEPWLGGLTFEDGDERAYRGGFAMYGKEYNAGLASSLGCDRTDAGAVSVDGTQETTVDGVYAVGDVTHGQNQTTIAIADGAKAGTSLHKDLRRFPRSPDDIDGSAGFDAPAAAADLRARMRLVRERDSHAGLKDPSPDQ